MVVSLAWKVFIKKGSASINPILGGVVLQFFAAIFGIVLLGVIIFTGGGPEQLQYNQSGLFWSSMAGIAVGTGKFTS